VVELYSRKERLVGLANEKNDNNECEKSLEAESRIESIFSGK
jgi:hypothetical protein